MNHQSLLISFSKRAIIFSFAFFLWSFSVNGQFWTDSFEDAGPTSGTRAAPNHTDQTNGTFCGAGDYFFRTDQAENSSTGLNANFSSIDGTKYWRGEDLTNCNGIPDIINWTGISISGKSNLIFKGLFAGRNSTSWDNQDFIKIEYQIDNGGFQNGICFGGGAGASNNKIAVDTNCDGTGDGTELTTDLTEFFFSIAGTGGMLDLRLTAASTSGEEFGLDKFTLEEGVSSNPQVTVDLSPTSVIEDSGTNLVYSFTRSGDASGDMTINFSVAGSATFSSDYSVNSTFTHSFNTSTGSITLPDGTNTGTINISPTSDSSPESDETIFLSVTSGTGYDLGSPSGQEATITDDETEVTITRSYPTVGREDSEQMIAVMFSRSGITTNALTINFDVGGSAVFNSDYTQSGANSFSTTSGSITILAGGSYAELLILTTNDAATEGEESIEFTITSGSYQIGNLDKGYVFIIDDETAGTLSQFWTDSFEDAGPSSGTRTAPNHTNQTEGTICSAGNYFARTSNLGAVSDPNGFDGIFSNLDGTKYWRGEDLEDCQGIPDVLNWTGIDISGKTNIVFKGFFAMRNTTSWENGDFLIMEYQIDAGSFKTGILFSGGAPSPDGNNTKIMVDFDRTGPGDIFLPDLDFREFTFCIPEVGSSLNLRFRALNGSGEEFGLDNFKLFSNPSQSGVRLVEVPATVSEDGVNNLFFNIISDCYNGTSNVNFTVSGSATFNTDYTQTGASSFSASAGSADIIDGSNVATIIVDPSSDSDFESDENVSLALSSANNLSIKTPNTASGTISNDDAAPPTPTITLTASQATQGESSGTAMLFTFTRTAPTTGALVVNFTVSGSADPTNDYSVSGHTSFDSGAKTGTITIADGQSTKQLMITPTSDSLVEGSETVMVTISAP